ncbi:MAG: outer membrane protein assembly factor BamB [Pseudomonadota bacterium]
MPAKRSLVPACRVLLLVLMVFATSACSWFSWLPFVGGGGDDGSRDGPAELVRFEPEIDLKREWSAGVGEGLGKKYLRLRPAVAADRIFAADGYGLVEARNRFTGDRLWRTRIGEDPTGPLSWLNVFDRRDPSYATGGVGAVRGKVLMGTARGEVVALAADDGEEVWRTEVGSEVLSTPVGGAGLVFVQTIDGRLLALEQDDGSVRWSFDNQVPVLTLRGSATPAYANGIVYAGFANGMLSAVRAENGEPVWQHRVMLPEGRSELERMVDVDGSPVLAGGIVYAVAYQGRLKALRADDGSLLWEQPYSSYLDLAEGYGQVYVIDEDDEITAIDQRNAEQVWRQEGLYRRKLSSPVAFSNYVVTGDSEGYLHVLAQSDGRFLGRRKVDGAGVRSRPVVAGDLVYVLGNSGSLQALNIEPR